MNPLILDQNMDKVHHVWLGMLLAVLGYFAAIGLGQYKQRHAAGIVASAVGGYAKEVWDKFHAGHSSDGLDFVATLEGGIAMVVILP